MPNIGQALYFLELHPRQTPIQRRTRLDRTFPQRRRNSKNANSSRIFGKIRWPNRLINLSLTI